MPCPRSRRLLPFASALLLLAAFPPVGFFPAAFVALAPLLLYLAAPDARGARGLCVFGAGLLFHLFGFSWIRHVTVVGMVLLAAYAALYWLLFAAVASAWRGREGSFAWPFGVAAAWSVLEHLRGAFLGGIPWFMLGHSQIEFVPFAQVADLAGVPGVTFLVVLANASAAHEVVRRRTAARGWRPTAPLVVAVLSVAAAAVYGNRRLAESLHQTRSSVDVLVIQGNIAQSVKKAGAQWEEIYGTYARLTREACAGGSLPEVVLWPETMHPAASVRELGGAPSLLARLPALGATHYLVGALVYDEASPTGARDRNSAVAVDPSGRVTGSYAKTHLVPVGEYFPIQEWALWKWIIRTFTALGRVPGLEAGTSLSPLPVGRWHLGVLICYESAFAAIAREEVRQGSDILVNLSNEAWYLDSAEMDQMLAMSRFRCIETRAGMARATNTGISAIIDPWGRVTGVVVGAAGRRKEVGGVLRGPVSVGPRRSVYLEYGDWLVAVCAAAAAVDLARRALRVRSARQRPPPAAGP